MKRRRVTQIFPFLLPLRRWQRKQFFYLKMHFDGRSYAEKRMDAQLPYQIFETSSLMINENSGYDIKYQQNKVHNLKLAAAAFHGLVIRPGQTFSFWKCAGQADKKEPYKDGLVLRDGKIVGEYGGGLCQISTMLYWMFLHSPLTIVERHGHQKESLPPNAETPCGTDATINEGWLDLKVENNTPDLFQIEIGFDREYMYGSIFSDRESLYDYRIYNKRVSYFREKGKIYLEASVDCLKTDRGTQESRDIHLYNTVHQVEYELPEDIIIINKGD